MTVHIGAKPGEIAETVLLPGDPYRARWAAETYLENPVLVNEVRGMLGYTGSWHGHPVTSGGGIVGIVTSGTYGPTVQRNIALAYVPTTLAKVGTGLAVRIRERDVPAKVVKTPFWKRSA